MEAKKKRKKSSEEQLLREKNEKLKNFIREDEGHLVEPYLGGYNSQKAKMLTVTFHPFDQIKMMKPRWRAMREMVEDT